MVKQKKPKAEKKTKPAQLERRVRVTFFLVAEIQEEVNVVRSIIHYLFQQYWCFLVLGEWELPVTGFTHSAIHDVKLEKGLIFTGLWWSETKVKIRKKETRSVVPIEENVVLFMIDLPIIAEEWKFDECIVHLKEKISSAYAMSGRPQEEIWIVKQDIYRYA